MSVDGRRLDRLQIPPSVPSQPRGARGARGMGAEETELLGLLRPQLWPFPTVAILLAFMIIVSVAAVRSDLEHR